MFGSFRYRHLRVLVLFFSVATITKTAVGSKTPISFTDEHISHKEDIASWHKYSSTEEIKYESSVTLPEATRSSSASWSKLQYNLFENDDKFDVQMREERLCDIGDGFVYREGEPVLTFETRCGSREHFPCYCAPDLDPPISCPYCGFHSQASSSRGNRNGNGNGNAERKEISQSDTFFCLKDGEISDLFMGKDSGAEAQECSCRVVANQPVSTCNPISNIGGMKTPSRPALPAPKDNTTSGRSPPSMPLPDRTDNAVNANGPVVSEVPEIKEEAIATENNISGGSVAASTRTANNKFPPVDNMVHDNDPVVSEGVGVTMKTTVYNNDVGGEEIEPSAKSMVYPSSRMAPTENKVPPVDNMVHENDPVVSEGVGVTMKTTVYNNDVGGEEIEPSTKSMVNPSSRVAPTRDSPQFDNDPIDSDNGVGVKLKTTVWDAFFQTVHPQAEAESDMVHENDPVVSDGVGVELKTTVYDAFFQKDETQAETESMENSSLRRARPVETKSMDNDVCTLTLDSGETKTFQRGESYGEYMPNKCNEPSKFPSVCNPSLVNQAEVPYCSFETGNGGILCAKDDQTVTFLAPGPDSRDTETCTCWLSKDPTKQPIESCTVTNHSNLDLLEEKDSATYKDINNNDDSNKGAGGIRTRSSEGGERPTPTYAPSIRTTTSMASMSLTLDVSGTTSFPPDASGVVDRYGEGRSIVRGILTSTAVWMVCTIFTTIL